MTTETMTIDDNAGEPAPVANPFGLLLNPDGVLEQLAVKGGKHTLRGLVHLIDRPSRPLIEPAGWRKQCEEEIRAFQQSVREAALYKITDAALNAARTTLDAVLEKKGGVDDDLLRRQILNKVERDAPSSDPKGRTSNDYYIAPKTTEPAASAASFEPRNYSAITPVRKKVAGAEAPNNGHSQGPNSCIKIANSWASGEVATGFVGLPEHLATNEPVVTAVTQFREQYARCVSGARPRKMKELCRQLAEAGVETDVLIPLVNQLKHEMDARLGVFAQSAR